jgi:hypothetical protein
MGLDWIFSRLMDFSEKGFRAFYRAFGESAMEKRMDVLHFPVGFSNSKVGEILTGPAEKDIMPLFSIITFIRGGNGKCHESFFPAFLSPLRGRHRGLGKSLEDGPPVRPEPQARLFSRPHISGSSARKGNSEESSFNLQFAMMFSRFFKRIDCYGGCHESFGRDQNPGSFPPLSGSVLLHDPGGSGGRCPAG